VREGRGVLGGAGSGQGPAEAKAGVATGEGRAGRDGLLRDLEGGRGSAPPRQARRLRVVRADELRGRRRAVQPEACPAQRLHGHARHGVDLDVRGRDHVLG